LALAITLAVLPIAVTSATPQTFNRHWVVVESLTIVNGDVSLVAEVNDGHTMGELYWIIVPAEYVAAHEDPLEPIDAFGFSIQPVIEAMPGSLGWAFGFDTLGSPPRYHTVLMPSLGGNLAGITGSYYAIVWSGVGAGPQLANQARYGPFQIVNGNYGDPNNVIDHQPMPDPGDTQPPPPPPPPPPEGISVTLNGTRLVFADADPIIHENRTMVPMRAIFEALGMAVEWDDYNRVAIGTRGELRIEIPIDSYTAYVNGEAVTLDVPAMLHNARTMVPVRFIAENSGANVEWNQATQTVVITQ